MKNRQETRNDAAKEAKAGKANEAVKKAAPQTNKPTYYVTADEVTQCWSIQLRNEHMNGYWDEEREYCIWAIPPHLVEAMELHDFFVTGRVIKAKG